MEDIHSATKVAILLQVIGLTCDPADPTSDHSILSTLLNGWDGEGFEHSLFRFFSTREACVFRLLCTEFLDSVTKTPWDDVRPTIYKSRLFDDHDHTTDVASPMHVNIPLWRACFPNAIGVRLAGREPLTDTILMQLRGILYIDASWEHPSITYGRQGRTYRSPSIDPEDYDTSVTDDGFQHLRGIRWLNLCRRNLRRITDAGFAHLRGIEHLNVEQTHLFQISPRGFLQLRGITTFTGCEHANPLLRCIHHGDYDAAIAMIGTVDRMWTCEDNEHSVFYAACYTKNKALICALLMHGIRPTTWLLFDQDICQFVLDQGY
jgi:hypothetical protein